MIYMKTIYSFFIALFLLLACNTDETTEQPNITDHSQSGDTLILANKFLLERDKELIESFIKRRDWKMNMTESGLWYEIYHHTNSVKVKHGDIILYNYVISLLDGTVCYTSDENGQGKIKIGQSGKEFGLDEGILMMNLGEKGRFILPPFLAHGLIGDLEKIPARSTIVYEIEIVDIIDF